MSRRPSVLKPGLVALVLILFAAPGRPGAAAELPAWVVDAEEAKRLITEGNATILDTRSPWKFLRGHVRGAVRADWTRFSQTDEPHRGKLLDDESLQAAIREVGVDGDRPVVVVGSPPGDWGEDGRIVWMLRAAGHGRVAFVDGGYRALQKTGVPTTRKPTRPSPGDFEVRRVDAYTATREQVRNVLDDGDALLIDTREEREYRGATPYGESRGGHVPGAKHLHFQELLHSDGRLLSRRAIRKKLASLGATPDTPIITYCTGGVRSGWMVAVLYRAGFTDVRNYAGSMWEWSAAPTDRFPLTK